MRPKLTRAALEFVGALALVAIVMSSDGSAAHPARARAQDLSGAARGIAGATVAIRVAAIQEREAKRDTTGLAATLGDASSVVRAAAAKALGRIQNRGSALALASTLRDRIPSVRREAAFALGLIGDTTAAPALAARLHPETDPAARVAMVTALGYLGARQSGPALSAALRSPRAPERWAAALAAARARDSTLVPALSAAAKDARPDMRWRVAYALGRIGDPRGAPALRTLARDPVEIVRYHAARALGDVADSASAPRLVALLADPAWRVRVNAAHALGVLGATTDARSLRPLLDDEHAHVRWEVAISLGILRDSGAVPLLTAALRDSATGVVQAAAIALVKIQGEAAIPSIAPSLDLLPAFLRSGLMDALGELEGPTSLEILLARARDDSDPPQAAGAASALGRRKGDRAAAIPVLRARLNAKDYTIVCSAAEALGALGDSASIPAIRTLLSRRGTPDDADIRSAARAALAALGSADSATVEPALVLRVEPIPARPATSAVIRTERGVIRIALDAHAAPRTVENFARLARARYFDGLSYHRVVPNFVVQDGCPRGDGWGGPGYAIPCEYNDKSYSTGTVGMALSGKDTGGSQWFITLSPQPRLEGRHTAFGEVISGMEVVERLQPGDRIVKVDVR